MTQIKVNEDTPSGGPAETKAEKGGKPSVATEKEAPQDWQARFEEKEKEAKDLYDRWLRLSAELENYKKRMEKEKSELSKFANESLIKDLLPVVDNLERALEHGKDSDRPNPLLEGVELTHKSLLAVLERHSLTRVEAVGETFDPNSHEAVMIQEDAQRPEGEVIAQMQIGYRLHNRLIRPAMVVVSKKPELNPEADPEA